LFQKLWNICADKRVLQECVEIKMSCQRIGHNVAENVIRLKSMIIRFRPDTVLFLFAPNSTLQ